MNEIGPRPARGALDRAVDAALAEATAARAPADLRGRVLARLAAEGSGRRRHRLFRHLAGGLAAAAGLAVLASTVLWLRSGGGPGTGPRGASTAPLLEAPQGRPLPFVPPAAPPAPGAVRGRVSRPAPGSAARPPALAEVQPPATPDDLAPLPALEPPAALEPGPLTLPGAAELPAIEIPGLRLDPLSPAPAVEEIPYSVP